jgi:hypothetical protein
MAAVPIITPAVSATLSYLKTLRLTSGSLPGTAMQETNTASRALLKSPVTPRKNSHRKRCRSYNGKKPDVQNFFSTHADILLQQSLGQAMIEHDRGVTGNASSGGTSVLNRYQLLQYRQNSSDHSPIQNEDIFLNRLNTTA